MALLTIQDLSLLVVEPSSMQQHLISKLCEELGVPHVDFVLRGQEALDAVAQLSPDVILSALYLEDMDSDRLLRELRNSEGNAHIPFILLSSETRFDRLDPLRQAGVAAILKKPFSFDELRKVLEHALLHIQQDELVLEHFDPEHLRVLIVDDSSMARKHIRHMLTEMGMRIFHEAENGLEGMNLFSQQEFDLVVTDLNMPAMDGDELVRHIRHSERSFVPILMVTSEQNQARLAAIQQEGVSAICDKPFELGPMRQALKQMLS